MGNENEKRFFRGKCGVSFMEFPRAFGKIYGVKLNKAEQKAMDEEINRQYFELDRKYTRDNDAAILWALHECFGFGEKRLRQFWEFFFKEQARLREHYQTGDNEGNLCKCKLKEIGVDIDKWHDEREESKNDI